MKTTVRHIAAFFENWAPKRTKLDYDNVGLMVGDENQSVSKIITCLDCTQSVVDEAIAEKADLIVAHHPLIFKKLSSVTAGDEQGRIIRSLVSQNISLLAVHTNLDAAADGVSVLLAHILGLKNISILQTTEHKVKLCFNTGSSAEYLNEMDEVEVLHVDKNSAEILITDYALNATIKAIKSADSNSSHFHWQKISSENENQGFGAIGEFVKPTAQDEFLQNTAQALGCDVLRFSGAADKITKVAVCGGSGAQLIPAAKAAGADAFVTADIKYHDYFTERENFLLVDTGHYENEVPIVSEMKRRLDSEFKDVQVLVTSVNTNPMKTFIRK